MSLLDRLAKPKPVSGAAVQPSPVVEEPSSSPIPPPPPNTFQTDAKGRVISINNKSARPSLLSKLAKPKSMGTGAGREPILVRQSVLDSEPQDTSQQVIPVPVVVPVPSNKPSLADRLRSQIKEKTVLAESHQRLQADPPIPPAPQPKASAAAPSPLEADIGVSYAGSSLSLKDKIALANRAEVAIEESFEPSILSPEVDALHLLDRYGRPIELNSKQADGCQMAINGQSFVLTGEAGTGKSTTIEAVLVSLLHHHKDKIGTTDYRANDRSGSRIVAPSVCVCAYTRKAIGNVARILSHNFELYAQMEGALQTVHNLLEYSPVIVWSEKQEREVKIFKPQRGEWNPLSITHLIIEEASMLGLDLKTELFAALNPGVQIIYVGDINQLPPVFGKSVMSYALTKLPIVHLDVVYRQALDNPIIANAHAVLHGKDMFEATPAVKWIKGNSKNKVAQPQETMSRAMGEFFKLGLTNQKRIDGWSETEAAYQALPLSERQSTPKPKTKEQILEESKDKILYNPEEDVVLIPFNKNAMGTKMINYRIAQHLGEEREAEVFEIIAGFEKHYLAVGDKVLCNKMEGVITKISGNMQYMGKSPMKSSVNLSRFGFYIGAAAEAAAAEMAGEDFDDESITLDILSSIDDNEERTQAASHMVTCELETGQSYTLSSAGEFNSQIFQLGYALSVHKSQGSEWRRVFLLFHKAHSTMLSRELLYTAMTRAREELVIVARPELITKAIRSPRIKGNSLAEKIEYFNSGYLD